MLEGHPASDQVNAADWMAWDEYDVGKWMKERDVGKYSIAFVENEVQGKNLPDCLDEDKLSGNHSSDKETLV